MESVTALAHWLGPCSRLPSRASMWAQTSSRRLPGCDARPWQVVHRPESLHRVATNTSAYTGRVNQMIPLHG